MSSSRVDLYDTIIRLAIVARAFDPSLSPYAIAQRLSDLQRYGKSLHRMYEHACSVDTATGEKCPKCEGTGRVLDPKVDRKAQCKRCEGTGDLGSGRFYRRIARMQDRATKLGNSLGVVLIHQSDPRGAAIQLLDRDNDRTLGYFT